MPPFGASGAVCRSADPIARSGLAARCAQQVGAKAQSESPMMTRITGKSSRRNRTGIMFSAALERRRATRPEQVSDSIPIDIPSSKCKNPSKPWVPHWNCFIARVGKCEPSLGNRYRPSRLAAYSRSRPDLDSAERIATMLLTPLRGLGITAFLFGAIAPLHGQPSAAASPDFFELKIRPMLAANCYSCHTGSQLGDLRVD